MSAREYLEVALAVINRPIPTSYYGIVTGLMWTLFSHVLFQVCEDVWGVVCEGVVGWEGSLGCACLCLFYLGSIYSLPPPPPLPSSSPLSPPLFSFPSSSL